MLVQELYNEVFAVELLLQQTLLVITDHELRNKMIRGIRWGEGGGARRGGVINCATQWYEGSGMYTIG